MYMKNIFKRKTKIICSIGPACSKEKIIEQLILEGMNIARFNFSHGNHESHKKNMDMVKRISEKTNKNVALLLDTKGPEIRTGQTLNDENVLIKIGDTVLVSTDDCFTTACTDTEPARISVTWKDFPLKASKGIHVLIADGLLDLEVTEIMDCVVKCVAQNSAAIGSRKNVNLIGLHPMLPIINEKDKEDLIFAKEQEVDFIAASFVSFASEVQEIRDFLDSINSHAKIIAKIENEEGVKNIEEITAAADGIMIARGDLGVQLPTEQIPLIQKHIIFVCRQLGKPVITATQMLESMTKNPRPTRAELTDVANAIFDGTDAVMLSGETANGLYPVEAVKTMAKIAITVEDSEEYCKKMIRNCLDIEVDSKEIPLVMAQNAYNIAKDIQATVIIAPTLSGHTAQMISRFRPIQPIVAVTPNPVVSRQLLLYWGVVPLQSQVVETYDEMIHNAIKKVLDAEIINLDDMIVLTAGIPILSPSRLNAIRVLYAYEGIQKN